MIERHAVGESGRIKFEEGMYPDRGDDRDKAGHSRDPDEILIHGLAGLASSFWKRGSSRILSQTGSSRRRPGVAERR